MSSNVDGVGSLEAADEGGGMSPDRSSNNGLTVNGGFVEDETALSSPLPSATPARNACCQVLQANMFRAIASTAEMAKRVADYERFKTENAQMSIQLAELHRYTEDLRQKRDELQAQADRAKILAETAQKHEDEMLKQLTAMEHNSAILRKKAEDLEDLQRKYTHLTVVLQDTQEKRTKSARDSKQLCNVVNNLKKDIEKQKEREEKLKYDKSAAMDRLKAYKKYVPMMIRTIDTLVAGAPDIHTRRRIDILAQPDVRLRLLGSSEAPKDEDETIRSDDDLAEDLESLIRSGVKAPAPVKPVTKKKAQKSPTKSPLKTPDVDSFVSPGKDLDDNDEEEELEAPHSSTQQPQFVTPPRRGVRATPSVYRRGKGGRVPAGSGRRAVRALADPEQTDKEMMNRLANKLSRDARDHSPDPSVSTAPVVVSSIHGKKGLTVREQQESQLKKMTVKERVALMRKEEAEKAEAPPHQDIVLPSTSKNDSMMDDLRLSPTPTKDKSGKEDSPDRDLLSDLRMSPSPVKSIAASEQRSEPAPPRAPVTFSLDDASDICDDMDYIQGPYSPAYPAETTAVPGEEPGHEVNPLAPEETPSSVPKATEEEIREPENKEEEMKGPEMEKQVVKETPVEEAPSVRKEKERTRLPVAPPAIAPSPSLPHLEAEWPSASTVRALEVMEKVAVELEPLLTPLKTKPVVASSAEEQEEQPVIAMEIEAPVESTSEEGVTPSVIPNASLEIEKPAVIPPVMDSSPKKQPMETTPSVSPQVVVEVPSSSVRIHPRVTVTRGIRPVVAPPEAPKEISASPNPSEEKSTPSVEMEVAPSSNESVQKRVAAPVKPVVLKTSEDSKKKSSVAVAKSGDNLKPASEKKAPRVTVTKGVRPNVPKEPQLVIKEVSQEQPIVSKEEQSSSGVLEKKLESNVIDAMEKVVDVSEESPEDGQKTLVTVEPIVQELEDSVDEPTVVEEEKEKPSSVPEQNPVVEYYDDDNELMIDLPDDNVPESPVRSEETNAETESPVEAAPSKVSVDEEEDDYMPRTRSGKTRVRTISNESETRRTPRKRVATRSTPRKSRSPSLKIDESDKESVVSAGRNESVAGESRAKKSVPKTSTRMSRRIASSDAETPTMETEGTPSTAHFKEPVTSKPRISRVRQESKPTATDKSEGKASAKTAVSAPPTGRRIVNARPPSRTEESADDDVADTPSTSRRIAHRPAPKQDSEKDIKKAIPVSHKPSFAPPPEVLDYIAKNNIDPASVNTILITGDDFSDGEEEEEEVVTAKTSVAKKKAPTVKEDSKQEKPAVKKPSTFGALRTSMARGAPASAQMSMMSSAIGKRLRQGSTVKCLPPLKATPKPRLAAPSSVKPSEASTSSSKPSATTTSSSKPSEAPTPSQATPAVPKPAPSKAIALEVPLPTKLKDRAPRGSLAKRKAEAMVSAVATKKVCREKRIESIIGAKNSPESLLERALDFDCDPELVKRKMQEEELEAIKSLSAVSFAKIMVEVAIRRNTGDQWFTFKAQMLRKNIEERGNRIENKSEERLINVPYELCGDDWNIFDPFIRFMFTYLASKRTMEPNACYKIVRLIVFAVLSVEQIVKNGYTGSVGFGDDPAKLFRSLITTVAHEHPECLGKSVVYMINTAHQREYVNFFFDRSSLSLRRLISLYSSKEEKDMINFVCLSRFGRPIELPSTDEFQKWYMELCPPEGTFSVHGDQVTISEEWISGLKTKELYFTSEIGVPKLLVEVDELDNFLSVGVLREYGLDVEARFPGEKLPTNPAVLSRDVVKQLALRLKSMSPMVSPLLLRDQKATCCVQKRKILELLRSCLTKAVRARKHLREKPSPDASQQTILLSLLTDFIEVCAPVFVLRS